MGDPAELTDEDHAELKALAKRVIDETINDGLSPLWTLRAHVRRTNSTVYDELEIDQLAETYILQMAQLIVRRTTTE